ncbi:MAG: hypothetical protein ACRBN8_05335 [Nannocystales bacterium]
MGKSEVTIAAPDSDLAVAGILGMALDEIRWRYPNVRVSCSAVMGPAISVLASSQPSSMPSLVGLRVVGQNATDLFAQLNAQDELVIPDVSEDDRLDMISDALLGDETRATALVPLRTDNAIVGFLQADSAQTGPLDPLLVEQLHQTAALASSAIQLERERTRSSAYVSRVQQLRTSMGHQTARQREAGLKLQQAVALLHEMVERVAPKVEQAERAELGSLIHRCAQKVDNAIDCLNEPNISRMPVERHRYAAS